MLECENVHALHFCAVTMNLLGKVHTAQTSDRCWHNGYICTDI